MAESEQIPLSDELLSVLRRAARKAMELREPFITPRTILLSLLDDSVIGAALGAVVNREKVLAARPDDNNGIVQLLEEPGADSEPSGIPRYDTLAFKTPDGRATMWLNREAYRIFLEGAQRVDDRYYPKHLALGLAAEAVQSPGVLSAVRVEPGILADVIYKL